MSFRQVCFHVNFGVGKGEEVAYGMEEDVGMEKGIKEAPLGIVDEGTERGPGPEAFAGQIIVKSYRI